MEVQRTAMNERRNVPILTDITLIKSLGEGGYGIVYEAESPTVGRVAAKTLHQLANADETDEAYINLEEENFYQEVEALMKFSHANIIKFHGVWFDTKNNRKIPYIISEIGECSFHKFLTNQISKAQAVKFAHQIAAGIKFVHENSVAHRDIKPQNIVLVKQEDDYVAKLIDFGESKWYGRELMKTFKGTSAYQDPKVLTGMYDESVDIYSFGCVMIQMLCGYESLCTWRFSKKNKSPVSSNQLPAKLANKLGKEIAALVRRCICQENRIQAAQLVEELALLEERGIAPLVVKKVNSTIVQYNLALQYFYGDGVDVDMKKAVELWTATSNQGDRDSQYNLGDCYYNGEGVERNIKEAIKWWTLSANQRCADAQVALGKCYYEGDGVEVNYQKAVEYFEAAAKKGLVIAQYNLGNCYSLGEGVNVNFEKAVELWTLAASEGDADSQFNLGEYYSDGDKDTEKAIEWWTLAANQGNTDAQFGLGLYFSEGKGGVGKDIGKAMKWWTLAAIQGNTDAQFNLGYHFLEGKGGVEKNIEEGLKWITLAAHKGDADSQCALGNCYYSGEGVELNINRAVEWWTMAAYQEEGDADAQYNLGDCYFYGEGVRKDRKKAIELWTMAANKNNAGAQFTLGECYFYGKGVKKNKKKAVELWTLASNEGDTDALFALGNCYLNGEGVKEDKKKALDCFSLAANDGHADSQYLLGLCYQYEDDLVEVNEMQAAEWYSLAAAQGHVHAIKALNKITNPKERNGCSVM